MRPLLPPVYPRVAQPPVGRVTPRTPDLRKLCLHADATVALAALQLQIETGFNLPGPLCETWGELGEIVHTVASTGVLSWPARVKDRSRAVAELTLRATIRSRLCERAHHGDAVPRFWCTGVFLLYMHYLQPPFAAVSGMEFGLDESAPYPRFLGVPRWRQPGVASEIHPNSVLSFFRLLDLIATTRRCHAFFGSLVPLHDSGNPHEPPPTWFSMCLRRLEIDKGGLQSFASRMPILRRAFLFWIHAMLVYSLSPAENRNIDAVTVWSQKMATDVVKTLRGLSVRPDSVVAFEVSHTEDADRDRLLRDWTVVRELAQMYKLPYRFRLTINPAVRDVRRGTVTYEQSPIPWYDMRGIKLL